MSLFRRRPHEDSLKALRGLQESVAALETRLRALETDQHSVRADVDLQWEKVNRAIGRLAKREGVSTPSADPDGGGERSADQLNEAIRRGDPI